MGFCWTRFWWSRLPFKTRNPGDLPEHGAVGPVGPAGDHRHQPQAERFEVPEAGLIFENVDGLEFDAVFEQELLGLQAARTARLPVDFKGWCCLGFGHVTSSFASGHRRGQLGKKEHADEYSG